MMGNKCRANECICCTVTKCKHHCKDKNFCSLSKVSIRAREPDPTGCKCTDCESFEISK